MKILIIDGQGGRMGGLLTEKIKKASIPGAEIYALGTNSTATAAMLKAGADYGATGENPVLVNCRDADYIIGPLGIMAADALLGEATPAMAVAVGRSHAMKILPAGKQMQPACRGRGGILHVRAGGTGPLLSAFLHPGKQLTSGGNQIPAGTEPPVPVRFPAFPCSFLRNRAAAPDGC